MQDNDPQSKVEQSSFSDVVAGRDEKEITKPVVPVNRANVPASFQNIDADSSEECDDEYGAECDPNGDIAICEACNKVLPLSKYEKHVSYFCKK